MSRPNIGDLIPIGAVGTAQQSDVKKGVTFSSDNGVGLVGSLEFIKSIQSGTFTLNAEGSKTIAISNVDPQKCHIEVYGNGYRQIQQPFFPYITSLIATELNIATYQPVTGTMGWNIIEFNPDIIKSLQRGVVNFSNENIKTIPISSVNPEKCFVKLYGATNRMSGTSFMYEQARKIYIDSFTDTSLVIKPSIDSVQGIISWEIIEFN